ncbi:MAG: DUF3494 domain-containing protein [Bacteroidales bacterium]|nr:DUF3494 domain-containing protein [Bacteroidales bacterium]
MNTNRKRLWITSIIATLLLAVFIVGCKKDDFEDSPGVCPLVITTNPANDATGIPINQIITATFNEKMNPGTITQSSFTLQGGLKTNVAGTITYDEATATLIFTPSASLAISTTYTGTVKTTVKDLRGNALQTNYIWSFTTGNALVPTVISTDPVNNASAVVLNKIVYATFSMEMDPLTITASTFTLKQGTTVVAGTVSYLGTTASFNPVNVLVSNTIYTATITTGAKNAIGVALAANYVWTFTTGTLLAPTVISTSPANNATAVLLNTNVSATFSVPMDPLTITTTTFTLRDGLSTIPGTITYNGSVATFNPTADLQQNTVYTGTITTGAKNVAGTPLSNNYVWSFTTLSTTAPLVISTDPANNATDVVLDKNISATFDMPMDPLTITSSTFILRNGLNSVSGSVSYSGSTALFNPDAALLPNTVYTATITTGVKNASGIALAVNYVWSFTTLSTAPPTVILTNPLNNATDVVLNKIVSATFSMQMDPLSLNVLTFTLKNGTIAVPGMVTYSGRTAYFASTNLLQAGTLYTATITTGAKNLAGIALENNYVWTFTTSSVVAPTVISTDPANNASGVVLDKNIAATFSVPMDPLTINNTTFTLLNGVVPVTGVVSYSGTTATFNPTIDLVSGTVYTATITTGAKNVAGIPLEDNYVWTFTTTSGIAPTVIATDPINNASYVVLDKTISATFSVPMDPLTINNTTFTLLNGANPVAGVVSYSGTTATFNPTIDLVSGTVYTATITTGAKNVAGIPLEDNYVWTFTTSAGIAPTVISTDPANNDSGVVLDKIIAATFSVPMDPLTITDATFILMDGTTAVTGSVVYSGTTATFIPSANLLAGTEYTATITTGAENLDGVALENDFVWVFTTLTLSSPTVISTIPADNATNVALNQIVSATFSEPMDPLTITDLTFTLFDGGSQVVGLVTYSGSTASFAPSVALAEGILYTATITTGAMNPDGTPLELDFVWSFTTLTVVIPTVDLASAAMFGAFGGNAGITNQGINTVINGAIATTAASTLVTGFHDGLTGDVYTETPLNVGLVTDGIFTAPPFPGTAESEAIATQALLDATAAYISISPANMPGGIDPGAGELGGLTLAPGVYMSASGTFNISNGPLTLDAQGDPNATWVFQSAAGLTVGIAGPTGARSVIMTNGALPKNVFWYVGSAATINAAGGGIMVGTIISTAGVTFSTPDNMVQTVLDGRAISLVASVTMVNTTINVPAP